MSKIKYFLREMGSVFNLFPRTRIEDFLPNYDPMLKPEERDILAIKSDWEAVGWDIKDAINRILNKMDIASIAKNYKQK